MSEAASADRPSEYTPEMLEKMDTHELLKLYKTTGDESLKWPLVLRYEDLVKSVALQIRGVYNDFAQIEDIINEGLLTLFRSIDKYDIDRGVKFETYVCKRIRGMVIDLARKQDWIPRNIRQRSREINTAIDELTGRLGRFPTETEVAEKLGISESRYRKDVASIALGNVLHLDAMVDAETGYQMEVPNSNTQGQPETVLQENEMRNILAQGIASLRENEQIVLSLYYEKNLKLKEIAQVMQLSEPRISQIHTRAIQKLHTHMEHYLHDENHTGHQGGKKKNV